MEMGNEKVLGGTNFDWRYHGKFKIDNKIYDEEISRKCSKVQVHS